jgi:hypothetical protein
MRIIFLAILIFLQTFSQIVNADEGSNIPIKSQKTILIIGDSLADGIWSGVYRQLRSDKNVKVLKETQNSVGLIKHDWHKHIKNIIEHKNADTIIISVGANDGQALLQADRKRLAYKTKQWKEAYIGRVNDLMNLMHTHNINAIWVGLPIMRTEIMQKQAQFFNNIYAKSAVDNAITFLPIWNLTADNKGKYRSHSADSSGKKKLLRANDGVHFTGYGYSVIAKYILSNLNHIDSNQDGNS